MERFSRHILWLFPSLGLLAGALLTFVVTPFARSHLAYPFGTVSPLFNSTWNQLFSDSRWNLMFGPIYGLWMAVWWRVNDHFQARAREADR